MGAHNPDMILEEKQMLLPPKARFWLGFGLGLRNVIVLCFLISILVILIKNEQITLDTFKEVNSIWSDMTNQSILETASKMLENNARNKILKKQEEFWTKSTPGMC